MSEQNKNVIRMIREQAMRAGNADKLDGVYTDDYAYHGGPVFGERQGPTAFKEFFLGILDGIPDFEETVEDQVAEGDKVATRITGRGHHSGDLMGAAPTGKELRWTAMIISRLVDGKVAEEWVDADTLTFAKQLGMVP